MSDRSLATNQPASLCDALDRLLDTGIVALGEVKISVADVDLIYVGLQLVVTSIESGRRRTPTDGYPALDIDTPWNPPDQPARSAPSAASPPASQPPDAPTAPRLRPVSTPAGAEPSPSPPPASAAKSNVEKNGWAQLVLTLVKLLHQLLKLQALRRMESGSLTDPELDRLGTTLMRQAQEIERMAKEFGLKPEDLNLDLGPLGKLM